MFFKNLCVRVILTKVASALGGLSTKRSLRKCSFLHELLKTHPHAAYHIRFQASLGEPCILCRYKSDSPSHNCGNVWPGQGTDRDNTLTQNTCAEN